jgi:hypothetical protein
VKRIVFCCAFLAACASPRGADPAPAATVATRTTRPVKVQAVDTVVMLPVKVDPETEAREAEERASLGSLVGRITDAQTGEPVRAAIFAEFHWEMSEETGEYRMTGVDPGTLRVTVESTGYRPEQRTITFAARRVDTMNVALRRAAPVSLSLSGTWHMRFKLRDAGIRRGPPPAQRVVEGTINFIDTLHIVDRRRPLQRDRYVWTIEGLSDIDFSPFFGGRIGRDVSTTVFGGQNETFEREAIARVVDGDSVDINLIPRISHGGVSFAGRMRGDSIVGRWFMRAYAGGATGDVVLRRVR